MLYLLMTVSKRGRKPKYLHTIVLDGINARDLYRKYKDNKHDSHVPQVQLTPVIEYSTKVGDSSTTELTELSPKTKPTNIYLEKTNANVTMQDYINYGCLPERTDLWCYHCHHPFNTSPIGLPIKYEPRREDKKQDSEITGTNDYFLTYGVFCSFPCCLAYLREHPKKTLFRNSKSLLYSLYYKLYNKELNIKPAPSWECLKVHGGNLSIEEFRKSFCNCNYIITENIKRPYMIAVGKYIEEKRCGYI